MNEDDQLPQDYWIAESACGLCAVPAEAVRTTIEHCNVTYATGGGTMFDAVVLWSPRTTIPAIDLRARNDVHDLRTDAMVLQRKRQVALVFDRLVGKVSLMPRQIHELNDAQRAALPDYVGSVTFLDGQPVAVLDLEELCPLDDDPIDRATFTRRLDRRQKPREAAQAAATPTIVSDSRH